MENIKKIKEEIIKIVNEKLEKSDARLWTAFVLGQSQESILNGLKTGLYGSDEDIKKLTEHLKKEIDNMLSGNERSILEMLQVTNNI